MTNDSFTTDFLDPPADYAPVDGPTDSAADAAATESTPESISAEEDVASDDAEAHSSTRATSESPRKTVKLPRVSEQPFIAGQCTVTITLTLPPGDGPILIGVRSHDAAPLLATLPRTELPDVLRILFERHLARLPELAAQSEAEKARRSKASAAKSSKPKASTQSARKEKPADKTPPSIPQRDLFAEFDQRAAAPSTPTSEP